MRLSRMAVKLDNCSDESGYELTLPEIHIASHAPRISTLVRFPREELLPEKDFLNPSLADSPAHPPQNPGFPQRQGGRLKPGQALSDSRIRVVP
jgi:hypothetical protein